MRSWVGLCFINLKAWSNLGTLLCSAAISLETDGDLELWGLTFHSLADVLGHFCKNRDVCPHFLVNRGRLVQTIPSPWGLALDANCKHHIMPLGRFPDWSHFLFQPFLPPRELGSSSIYISPKGLHITELSLKVPITSTSRTGAVLYIFISPLPRIELVLHKSLPNKWADSATIGRRKKRKKKRKSLKTYWT